MPGTKDIVLASLIEKDLPENPKIYLDTTKQDKLDSTQSLAPLELIEQYDNEFRSFFSQVLVDSKIISSNTFFSVKYAGEHNKERLQILREHNYCKSHSKP